MKTYRFELEEDKKNHLENDEMQILFDIQEENYQEAYDALVRYKNIPEANSMFYYDNMAIVLYYLNNYQESLNITLYSIERFGEDVWRCNLAADNYEALSLYDKAQEYHIKVNQLLDEEDLDIGFVMSYLDELSDSDYLASKQWFFKVMSKIVDSNTLGFLVATRLTYLAENEYFDDYIDLIKAYENQVQPLNIVERSFILESFLKLIKYDVHEFQIIRMALEYKIDQKEDGYLNYLIASCYSTIEDYENAYIYIKDALDIEPNNGEFLIHFMEVTYSLGKLDEFKESIDKVDVHDEELEPTLINKYIYLCQLYYSNEGWNDKILEFGVNNMEHPQVVHNYLKSCLILEKYDEFFRIIDLVEKNYKNEELLAPFYVLKAEAYNRLNKPEEALKSLKKCEGIFDYDRYYLTESACSYQLLNNYAKAIEYYEKVENMSIDYLLNYVACLYENKEYEKVIAYESQNDTLDSIMTLYLLKALIALDNPIHQEKLMLQMKDLVNEKDNPCRLDIALISALYMKKKGFIDDYNYYMDIINEYSNIYDCLEVSQKVITELFDKNH